MKYILGIDNGGSLTKAAVFTTDGTLVAVASRSVPMVSTSYGGTERDMEALWRANVASIQDALKSAGLTGADIAAVSVTGHGNGLYLVDAAGHPVHNAIISTDARAEDLVKAWTSDPRFVTDILPKTAQSLWPGQPPALLAWLQQHVPDEVDRARWVMLVSGFVRLRLTGEATANLSDVSGTSILNVAERVYDDEILEYYGIGGLRDKLPRIVDSAECAGHISAAAAAETGLAEGTPVAGGVFDIAGSALASGLIERNQLAIVTGTWSINEYLSDTPVIDPDLFMTSIYPTGDEWLVTEGSPTSAGVLEWLMTTLLPQAARELGGGNPSRKDLFRIVDKLVFEEVPASAHEPAFLPFVYGTSKYPSLRGVLAGLDSSNDLAQVLRAVYEGIVFGHMDHIRTLERFTQLKDEAIFTGGVINSRPWTQMFADAMQRPLHVTEVKEAGTLGTAMAAAVMLGEYGSLREAARAMGPGFDVVEPNPAAAARYQERYETWNDALQRMKA